MDYFFACKSCKEITGPCDDPFHTKLKCCAKPGSEPWPSPEALLLLGVAEEQLMERRGGRRVAAVFLASAFERLLEEAARPLLRTRDQPRGREEWLTLFEARTPKKVGKLLATAGLPGFERNWDLLARLRNQIAHGKYTVETTMDGSVLKSLCNDALPAFVALARASRAAAKGRSPQPSPSPGRRR